MMAWKKKNTQPLDIDGVATELMQGSRGALAKAITLVESNKEEHRYDAEKLLEKLDRTTTSFRIGVSGIPGAGKSTFIEDIGLSLCENGEKVAVLAIDPSSRYSKGSILGDKTRMERLSLHPNAFVRPTSTGGTLGGVHHRTTEVLYLCEAAGYQTIFVETVGVGQSEGMVRELVDCFILLLLSRTGDDLQGVKRGILELADVFIINKADPNVRKEAENLKTSTEQLIQLFTPSTEGFEQEVWLHSTLLREDKHEIVKSLERVKMAMTILPSVQKRRFEQLIEWSNQHIRMEIQRLFEKEMKQEIAIMESKLSLHSPIPYAELRELIRKFRNE
ncbi:methylmalonyl Co-A mutase-associated GTPase MeaB [Mangrovibacillus cuniculi]|uniref:Methylmalonyl Co-A mutase-associated GTPase MeaB n=1 Tax=Mangrovibacillus cuniculi TaxID=2593652 RepID=A0A7S8CB89_9BACI|nr:methylmalonyl Co-A mutase-associated GTPase MeaB [Mangrovibacillus cuniculi]QPC46801.1 methylmalonyl Co-A mutase-associated GTPase MeaB [Mangrovibacillus cuniculi]